MGKEAKNEFLLSWPNMALSQKNLDKSIWSLILRDQKHREEEEEEEKKNRREEERKIKKGMDSMIFGMDITWKVRILWFYM